MEMERRAGKELEERKEHKINLKSTDENLNTDAIIYNKVSQRGENNKLMHLVFHLKNMCVAYRYCFGGKCDIDS